MPLNPGHRLGPYEILEPLGAGGMGEVYRAKDTRLDRSVAIKILPGHLSANPELRQRFDREARAISSLTHPHICALYDVGHEDGTDFLVMEYLEGMPLEEVLRIGREIAEALAAAHRSGVVHRDLKPGNVILTRSGAKLLDFGLAKTGAEAVASDSSLTMKAESSQPRTPLTAEGMILGTFQYMAPEQLEGKEADPRTDIFALGAVLYEMATGKRAFQGKSQASLIASILKDQPAPISTVQAMTPPALDRVVRVCLEKDPDARWQTAHDVALQLKWIAEGGSAAGVPRPLTHRRRTRERGAWIAAAVFGVVAVALGARELFREPPPEPPTIRFQIPVAEGLATVGTPKISPDGRYLAMNATDTTGTPRIWIQPLDALTAHPLEGTRGAKRPFWSPDSRSLAFFAGSQLERVDVAGGAVRVLLDGVNGSDGTWSPEGVILFDGSSGDSIRSVPATGGQARPATRIDRAVGQNGHAWPHFLPDGKHFLFQAHYGASLSDSLLVGELGSFETRTLGPANSLMDYSDPGYVLWVDNNALLARRFDPGSLRFEGDAFPVTTRLSIGTVGLANFSVSRNGILVYRSGGTDLRTLSWVDRSGHELSTVGPPGAYGQPAVGPGGTRIVVDGTESGSPTADLWLLDASRGTTSRFTYGEGQQGAGVWSPDGSRIAYGSYGPDGWNVLSKDARGSTEPVPVWSDSLFIFPTDWSSDGKTLIVQRQCPGTGWDIWTCPLEGDGGPVPVVATRFIEAQGRLSPDGKWIAYVSSETGHPEIYVRSYPGTGGKWQISTGGGLEPFWRGDGEELYYLSMDRELMAVSIDTDSGFHAGRPVSLFRAPVPANIVTRNRYVPSADGQRFLMVEAARSDFQPTTVVVNWTAEVESK
jgi:Tol biopolymer transport system component/predicted Ser/Thr protein kinase